MSRTADQPDANGPASPPFFHPALPEGLLDDLGDQLEGIRDVQLSLDLLATLLDPLTAPSQPAFELDREQAAALLRVVNGVFAARLACAKSVLASASP